MIASLAATVEISVDAAVEAILSGLDSIFKLKEEGMAALKASLLACFGPELTLIRVLFNTATYHSSQQVLMGS